MQLYGTASFASFIMIKTQAEKFALLHSKFVGKHGISSTVEAVKTFNWVIGLVEKTKMSPQCNFIYNGNVLFFICVNTGSPSILCKLMESSRQQDFSV